MMTNKQRTFRVDGIVLKHDNWGEADRQLTLFTRELGKVRALAKGVRKPKSRKAGHVEPFMRSTLLLARGRDFYILTQAETLEANIPLREDLVILGYAAYIIELLDKLTYEEGENNALYRLLSNTLRRLSRGDNPGVLVHYYEIRLLDLVGFRPQLFNCVKCEEMIQEEDQYFSARQGGVLCPKCGAYEIEARPINARVLKYFRHFQRSTYAEAGRAKVSDLVNAEIEKLMQYYFTSILERGLNTPSFLRRMRQEQMQEDQISDQKEK